MFGSRKRTLTAMGLVAVLAGTAALPARAEDKAPAGKKSAASLPPVEIVLGPAEGTATPITSGHSAYAGGGNITVNRIDPTTVVITMTGAAAAHGDDLFHDMSAGFQFMHAQDFEVVFNSTDVKSAKLTLEAAVVGRLRTYCESPKCSKNGGTAEITTPGCATVNCGPAEIATVHRPARETSGGDSLVVHNREGPVTAAISAGKFTLHGSFGFVATAPHGFFNKFDAADFSPEWVLDLRPLGFPEPFIGYGNKDFGFTITLKVVPE
jgi:hypothetical protein